jgi:NADPH:quinone reductase-like Zn-dependent oxidoreductase
MKETILSAGADQYLDYRKENYWEVIEKVDFVIDTIGKKEFEHELSVIKPGGRLLSLLAAPNKKFAKKQGLPFWKQLLFGAAGSSLDKLARKQEVDYRFIFVRADGQQLKQVARIIEEKSFVPIIEDTNFTLDQVNEALELVAHGHPKGKVVLQIATND